MKYVVLIAGYPEGVDWDEMTADDRQVYLDRHQAFADTCRGRDGVEIRAGEALGDGSMATTLRTSHDGTVTMTDGPFAEAAEHIGGFYLLEVPDLEVLTEICSILPPYILDLRPVIDVG